MIKSFIPKFVHTGYMVWQTYVYDCFRTLKFSFAYRHDTANLKANLLMVIHTVEKGLTMPNPRVNFGHDKIKIIIDISRKIVNKNPGDKHSFEIKYALDTLNDYIVFHEKRGNCMNQSIQNLIMEFGKEFSYSFQTDKYNQYHFTKEDFFKNSLASFDEFAKSRHTVRNYNRKEIPDEIFYKIANIASISPSSCNRQTCKFYLLKNKEMINSVLALQGGNRGFGDTASAVMVVTSNLTSYLDVQERTQSGINAGFYGMNLLYALHFFHIGACVLNWSYTKKKDKALRHLIPHINEEEQICFLISCGYPVENFEVALSKRKEVSNNIIIIK